MEWDKCVKLCNLLNHEHYEEAVDLLLINKDSIDAQSIDMFITGFDLSQPELALPIKSILNEWNGKLDSWRASIRLNYLCELL